MPKAASTLIVDGKEGECFSCCHCGAHHVFRSAIDGMVKGKQLFEYCARCHGVFCAPGCRKCVPKEQQLENIEAGRHRLAERPLVK